MGEPARPTFQKQGPASNCVIQGKQLGWLSCTAYAMAMLIDRVTLGAKRPSGCDVRANTVPLDTVGGTTLPQVAGAARNEYGVAVEVRVGSNVCSPAYGAAQLRAGRPVLLQGNAGAMLGTAYRSTKGYVNHAVLLNEGRGWRSDGTPSEVLVYDPAADGRQAGWGRAAKGPQWWPWSLVLRFAALLRPSGDDTKATLGWGRWYCGIGADTEPHMHSRFGGRRHEPFPEARLATPPAGRKINVRAGPSTSYPILFTMSAGLRFIVFQEATGQELVGSRRWYGDHNGTKWVHETGLKRPA